jgi:hypothetical protein
MLHANGVYDNIEKPKLSEEEMKYAEYYIKSKTDEIDSAIEYFPNHYEFLKDWYERTSNAI